MKPREFDRQCASPCMPRSDLLRRGDQREAHNSGKAVSLEALKEFGVTYRQVQVDDEGKWEDEISVCNSRIQQAQR